MPIVLASPGNEPSEFESLKFYCMFCNFMSILVLGKRERELDALLSLSSWCHMQFVIVIFPNHTQLLFLGVIHANSDDFGESVHLLGLVLAIVTVQNSYVVAHMAIECPFVRAAKALASLHICTD